MININFGQMAGSEEFINICKNHPECKGCPMIGGKQYQVKDRYITCGTGYHKKESENE